MRHLLTDTIESFLETAPDAEITAEHRAGMNEQIAATLTKKERGK